MNELHKSDGTFTTNQKEILEGQAKFYSELYKSKSTINKSDILTYLDNIEIPKLSIKEKNFCDGDLTIDECYDTLKTFSANKTPGNDGLSVEFYKQFWCWIGKPMVQCFNRAFTKGELSTSQRQAVITVLDKGKDRSLIKNWRPISLLNVDYEKLSKTLANRLKVVLPKLIHHNQVGFITGRNIAENLRAISDIFDYTKDFNVPGILISVDFHKAFDSLTHTFLYAVLEKFNLGPIFCQWILLFYTSISSCVINNGTTSTYFAVDRGVCQGDPLSPYLFVLAVEILVHMIRVNKNIKGLKIMNQMIKLLQCADDTLGIVQDEISAKHFLQVIIDFGHISGLTLNMTKTEAVWLEANRNRTDKPLTIRWPALPIKVLGV